MGNNPVLDYIRATTNLYGLVPPEKLVEIYNQQNEDAIDLTDLEQFRDTQGEFFEYFEGYFVHEAVFVDDSVAYLKAQQAGKPYYVPPKNELLKYADDFYMEKTKEYKQLSSYIRKNIVHDLEKADELTEDIQLTCAMDFSIDSVMNEFNRRNISFKSQSQIMEFIPLIMELANNTRIWENRGHTPNEIFSQVEQAYLGPLPEGKFSDVGHRIPLRSIPRGATRQIGRNDPCPCGSGKKYKKCCLGTELQRPTEN